MTVEPRIELLFHPTDLDPRDLKRAGEFLGSPAQALEAGLGALRLMMIDRMKAELATTTDASTEALVRIADLAWQATFWKFRKISAPVLADAYIRAYRRADAGDVPIQLIYDLADRHTDRIGDYFHTTSKTAMVEGFNTYVNRRLGAKAAADRVMDAYGLTPRQMRGYTSATQTLEGKVNTTEARSLKGRIRQYITRSFRQRIQKLVEQEEHNVDQQAQQFAWMWLVDKGRLSPLSEKVWITAKDERVCVVCGPLHGQRVGVNEKFVSPQGEFWTPGVHPNCRCWVRLLENTFKVEEVGKADWWAQDWEEEEHPRDRATGRFADKPKPRVTTQTRTAPADAEWIQRMRAIARADVVEAEQEEEAAVTPVGYEEAVGYDVGYEDAVGYDVGYEDAVDAPAKPKTKTPVQTEAVGTEAVGYEPVGYEPVGYEAVGDAPITVEALQEANPSLTIDHLVASMMGYDEATEAAMVSASAPTKGVTRMAEIYDIPGDTEDERMLYLYAPSDRIEDPDASVRFTTNDAWLKGSEGRKVVFNTMVKEVEADIQKKVTDVIREGGKTFAARLESGHGWAVTLRNSRTGEAFYLTEDELRDMVTDTAYKRESEPLRKFVWDATDPSESRGVSRDVTAQEVMDLVGITAKDFEKTVYATQRGYHEHAVPTQSVTLYGHETWLNTGEFEITDTNTGYTPSFAVLANVEPMVAIQELPND